MEEMQRLQRSRKERKRPQECTQSLGILLHKRAILSCARITTLSASTTESISHHLRDNCNTNLSSSAT
ncbi:hypothetical protein DPMN_060532 [Dreissena polymorpha]|uniref:Uncharacterized protein n=1 Tax=Dreissena polymorpha TaxID=45954 RepID=A0A9D4HG45_DREPO|nr:hypothetical protein DPMN_060532 [Dreissena polymorpha]